MEGDSKCNGKKGVKKEKKKERNRKKSERKKKEKKKDSKKKPNKPNKTKSSNLRLPETKTTPKLTPTVIFQISLLKIELLVVLQFLMKKSRRAHSTLEFG